MLSTLPPVRTDARCMSIHAADRRCPTNMPRTSSADTNAKPLRGFVSMQVPAGGLMSDVDFAVAERTPLTQNIARSAGTASRSAYPRP